MKADQSITIDAYTEALLMGGFALVSFEIDVSKLQVPRVSHGSLEESKR